CISKFWGLRNDLERLKRALEAKDSRGETKKEGLLLVEFLAGCTSTSKAAHTTRKLPTQLESYASNSLATTEAAHAANGAAHASFLRQQSCLRRK
ncbi:hypothetical protein PIB30_076933, partial [Stylosanthes scabra]|nr:hypothetical protein [Stylosanthes scabra]